MKKISFVWVLLIAGLTVSLRLYKIDRPIADWHSFRQVDTASVARIFVEEGIDILHPRYHDLSNIQSGKDNPQGFRMVELPLYQAVAAMITRTVPAISIELSLRAVTVAAAAGTAILLTALSGVVAGIVYAVLPYSIFYGSVVLPETFAVFWAMLALFLLHRGDKGNRGNWGWIIWSAISGAIALLVKPTAGFLLLPVPYLLFRRVGFSLHWFIGVLVYLFIGLFPLGWWRTWIAQFPEGIPVFDWLLNKDNIRFKGAWFHWLFAKRLGELILGYWGLIPFGMGLMGAGIANGLFGLGGLLYFVVFAAGNVQHDYYQIILLPIISMFVGRGFEKLWKQSKILGVVCFLFMIAFSWYTIRTFYWINRPEIIEAGKMADAMLPKNAKVIVPYNGDTTFLYQTKRVGWPLGFDIDKKLAQGATHYVTVSPTDNDWETKTLAEKYTVLVRNEKFAIIDLTKPHQ